MGFDETAIIELKHNFKLLQNIVRPVSMGEQSSTDLKKLEKIIKKKIPETFKGNAPENFYELYMDFKAEYERFKNFILYDKLIGKNIVALGGAFSSGKSAFLNVLLEMNGEEAFSLPEANKASTSVPTYIIQGDESKAVGINEFDARIEFDPKDIDYIAHGFGKINDAKQAELMNEVPLGHVLKNIVISTPYQKYEKIAFLDTPGYSKPDTENYSKRTDEQIARRQLNSSNFILWFIGGTTITESDIRFLKSLHKDIPKLIVISHADLKPLSNLKSIVNQVKSELVDKNITFVDVLVFTTEEVSEPFILSDKEKIYGQISDWNKIEYEQKFARNFKILFIKCKDYYLNKINEVSRKRAAINDLVTKHREDIDENIYESFKLMANETKEQLENLKALRTKLNDIQVDFFGEIKKISDDKNITNMPEPSELDLIEENSETPFQLIEDYMKEKGFCEDRNISTMLQNEYTDIEVNMNKAPGGIQYKSELFDIIMETCNIKPEEIHINDFLQNTAYNKL